MPDIAEERAEAEQARLLPNASNVTEGNADNVSEANPPQRQASKHPLERNVRCQHLSPSKGLPTHIGLTSAAALSQDSLIVDIL